VVTDTQTRSFYKPWVGLKIAHKFFDIFDIRQNNDMEKGHFLSYFDVLGHFLFFGIFDM
jgi:hypothetical protein